MFRSVFRNAALLCLASGWMGASAARAQPTLSVDVTGNPHPINPDVYGIFGTLDPGFAQEIQVPNVRWGGDATTRYNWQVDGSNAGFDWYFMGGNPQATITPSGMVDSMIRTYGAASRAHALITIPIIPYVNKLAAWTCSFPVSAYGPQRSTNPYVHPDGGDNCGNSLAAGTLPDGGVKQLMDIDIYSNHVDNSVALQQGWVQHLVNTFGTAANGGVPYYQLDNEPLGWSNTHRDVQPNTASYDTIISLGQQYAAMVKGVDPSSKVFGPVDFTLGGWIGTTTQQNGLYAGQYYLQQMSAYDSLHSLRILDYFDEHYYSGGPNDSAELASTRTLWDPTFNGGTWVEQFVFQAPMQLIPRFKGWIDQYYPGTKLSISEYSFQSGNTPIVDALTEADVLGIFGREGVDFANMFGVPAPTDPLAYSFRLFRNYDGQGGLFGDTSVTAVSTDQGSLSVYGALRSNDQIVTLLVINKTTEAIHTQLSLAHFDAASTASVFTYSGSDLSHIVRGSPVAVTAGVVDYNFPSYSATVFAVAPIVSTDGGFTPDSGALADSGTGSDAGSNPSSDAGAPTLVKGACGCGAAPISGPALALLMLGAWTRRSSRTRHRR